MQPSRLELVLAAGQAQLATTGGQPGKGGGGGKGKGKGKGKGTGKGKGSGPPTTGNFSKEEALDFLARVEKRIGQPIERRTRNNVEHYLIGDYQPKHHASMFGTADTFPQHGLGIFWENVIEGSGIRANTLWWNDSIRFANNDGANFRDHRKEAIAMFREAYQRIK